MSAGQTSPRILLADQPVDLFCGFELGMIWQQMLQGQPTIESGIEFNWQNAELFQRMAHAAGYEIECFDCCDKDHEWTEIAFHKRPEERPKLEIVK